jgi:hypothetical protein
MSGVILCTVTVNDAEAAFPCASVAEHCTVVVPNAKVAPLAGVQVVATAPSTLSVAEPEKLYTVPLALVASIVAFAGTVTAGAVESCTVTLNDADPVLPCASATEHWTIVVPNGKVAPLAGAHVVGIDPSMLSTADAVKL